MEKEEKTPIEIVCPHCGMETDVICHGSIALYEEGVLCNWELFELDVYYSRRDDPIWWYTCSECDASLEEEEVEELVNAAPPKSLAEQLKMEDDIDLFEDYWKKDQSQSKKGEE